MARLPSIKCPECHAILESREYIPNARGAAEAPSDYSSCLRRCEPCGRGFSNARTADVRHLAQIDRDPFHRLPVFLRHGWDETMDRALNEQNRGPKRCKFHSRNSEDHVTWVVFRHLHREGTLRLTLERLGVTVAASDAA